MGFERTRPLDVVQEELRYYLDKLPELRHRVANAAPGSEAVDAQRELERELARYSEVADEFRAHVTLTAGVEERPS